MTTSRSPLRVLRQQADRIAMALKQAERGETITNDPAGKIAAARARSSVIFGVVMDDKVIKIEMSWATIMKTTEAGLSEYMLKQMKNSREATH